MVEPLLKFNWNVNKKALVSSFNTFRKTLKPEDYIAPDR